jgi:hypothetical protein
VPEPKGGLPGEPGWTLRQYLLFKYTNCLVVRIISLLVCFPDSITSTEEYHVILKTRGPQNAALSRLPENRRAIAWQEILDEFKEKLRKDQYLHLTVSAHGLVLRKPFIDAMVKLF